MAFSLTSPRGQLEVGSVSKVGIHEVLTSPVRRERDERREGEDVRPMTSFMPEATERGLLHELTSARAWGNHVIWRAGVSLMSGSLEGKGERIFPNH